MIFLQIQMSQFFDILSFKNIMKMYICEMRFVSLRQTSYCLTSWFYIFVWEHKLLSQENFHSSPCVFLFSTPRDQKTLTCLPISISAAATESLLCFSFSGGTWPNCPCCSVTFSGSWRPCFQGDVFRGTPTGWLRQRLQSFGGIHLATSECGKFS